MQRRPIVYVPDPCSVDGKLITLSSPSLMRSQSQQFALVDIGLSVAKSGSFSLHNYIALIRRAVRTGFDEVAVVVPDAFWDFSSTVEKYKKYSPLLRKIPNIKLVFVAQQLKPPPEDIDADIVAVPSRMHGDVKCSLYPRTCAERIARFIDATRLRVHLLGPSKQMLKLILSTRYAEYIRSFDTQSYRLAPAQSVKSSGYKVLNTQQACQWLHVWLADLQN